MGAATARAQTYDPSYPVCLQTYGIDGSYIDCSFTSLAQCLTNPYFAQGGRKPSRHRGVYQGRLHPLVSGVMANFAHAIASTYSPANHPFREVT